MPPSHHRRRPLQLLFLAMLLPLAACGIRPRGVHQVGNWGPVAFLENGIPVRLYTLQVEEYHGPTLMYLPDNSTYSCILTEQPTKWTRSSFDHTQARQLWNSAPAWRREEQLKAVAARLTADQPPEIERFLISSHGPVVVGMSGQRNDYSTDGYFQFFLQDAEVWRPSREKAHRITRLFIYRGWPIPDASLGLLTDRHVLDLKSPMRIEQVMTDKPWEQSPPPAK